MVDQRDTRAQQLCFLHVMGGQEHGRAAVAQLFDEPAEALRGMGVHAAGGLVHDEHARVAQQRAGQMDPLHHAA
ncbi:hypothetical protein SMD44_04721 [Streptomyces alboflavus]|uniref:Uncharacterized protein n=1 Tax=Streptomyces alboflavus TaxID=67267 RepID=A0A1Z1WFZ1_9ACTN|nr:hypothetical protein [Streptomyces alboflavus]ARX85262.1 hypothetical protein SMD44_04721 [Streptomyces alboflavus]